MDYWQREVRLARAAEQVLKRYRLERHTRVRSVDGKMVRVNPEVERFQVSGGSQTYEVIVHNDWSQTATCTCPDFRRHWPAKQDLFCKHILAVLMKHEDVRHQLLDALL